MNTDSNTIKKLIGVSNYSLFTRKQRKQTGLNIHQVNILLTIYLLQEIQNIKNINVTLLHTYIDYLSTTAIRKLIKKIINDGFVLVGTYHYMICYSVSDKGIRFVRDILEDYDIVFRSYLEKHKLNELF